MSKLGTITRRTFLVASAAIVGGVVFGTYKYKQPLPNPLLGDADNSGKSITSLNAYLKIDQDGVTVITPKAEMGQGVQNMFAMLVAEELDLDWKTVRMEHGPASNSYYNTALLQGIAGYPDYDQSPTAQRMRSYTDVIAKFMGMQLTGGSTSTPDGFVKMRSAGASARIVLTQAAAKQWGVDAGTLKTENGYVINPANNEKLSYIELAPAAAQLEAPAEPPLRDPSEWRYLGKSMPRLDVPAKSTGTAEFAIDVRLPDMLHATVKMSPRFGVGIKKSNTAKAEAMPGVEKVIKLDNSGFAVIANNTWRAFKAANAIEVEWEAAISQPDDAAIFKLFADSLTGPLNGTHDEAGDVETALADAGSHLIEAEYRVPYLAHATMEPMTAVAQVKDGRIDIWTGAQGPTAMRDALAELAGVSKDQVHIHTTLLGGGFGRRSEVDFARQAYQIATQTNGRPVKLTWTREEDMRHGFYRPAALARFKGVMGDKKPRVFDAQIASPSIMLDMSKRSAMPNTGPDPTLTEGTSGQPEQIEHFRVRAYAPEPGIPVGFWRSVGGSFNGFVHESFMDELAASKGIDPVAMRLEMLGDLSPTATAVVKKVAEMAGWQGGKVGVGKGRGFAYTLSFGAHTAQIIDISVTDKGVRIDKVYCAVDVGTALDPRNVEAQIESAIVYGLSSALYGEINFKDGEAVQSNFHDYRVMRLSQMPIVEVAVLENNPVITGVGEPGTPPSLPALANAIFAATGKRIRELPMSRQLEFV